jgi:acyl carrier protein
VNREQVRTRLLEILTSKKFGSLQVDVSELTEETSLLNDITLDSLQLLEFIVAIENAFQFKVNTRRLSADVFDRFGSVIDFVHDSVGTRAAEGGVYAGETA